MGLNAVGILALSVSKGSCLCCWDVVPWEELRSRLRHRDGRERILSIGLDTRLDEPGRS